ncbi:response regulator transcription factor [Undibacterium fentianense]|uniref:Response regulator n=1 Tax=Undibacterium fentianense TaxID=2828728 RepID=A0A941E3C6_9BURK|nr:response regulator [Undibacterium fentianense]MBR7800736.1 response regulator [Undibacterium fentianense]
MSEQAALKVLIVDDYDMTRTLLKIILRGQRFEIVGEAVDGEEGVAMCTNLQPDIVLLDVVMPKLNGLEALAKIKSMARQPMVLMVSGAEESGVVEQAVRLGASGYILKPFNTASVIETMNQARDTFILRNAAEIKRH